MDNNREIKCLRHTLQSIIDLGYDYDGYENSLEGCKSLIDEFVKQEQQQVQINIQISIAKFIGCIFDCILYFI